MPVDRAKRAIAYHAIDTERDYQESLPPTRTDGQTHTVGEFVTMLQGYQNKLVAAWVDNPGDFQALDVMRKVAGICVNCFEQHGVPLRDETYKPSLTLRVEALRQRAITAKANGEWSVKINDDEYRDLVEAKVYLETWAAPGARQETFQTFEGLTIDRLG